MTLNPCMVLHLDENSAVRIAAARLDGTRIELLAGAVIIRADGILCGTRVTMDVRGVAVLFPTRGVYRADAEPTRLRVLDGKAIVLRGGQPQAVGAKRECAERARRWAEANGSAAPGDYAKPRHTAPRDRISFCSGGGR